MYWWDHAANLVRNDHANRFGLITTNSVRQTFNRRMVERHLRSEAPLVLAWAIPDHPWVDSADGAAVRVTMQSVAVERLLVDFFQLSTNCRRTTSKSPYV